jgi:hypothetical protein
MTALLVTVRNICLQTDELLLCEFCKIWIFEVQYWNYKTIRVENQE